MGGEITWECLPAGSSESGKFVFTMKIYRHCLGIALNVSPQSLSSNSPVPIITMNFVSSTYISPKCDPNDINDNCTVAVTRQDTGTMEEYVFRSAPVIISGVPPAAGWTFSWNHAARNNWIINILSSNFTIMAKMYPYYGQNTYPCFDSSPQLFERPKNVICTGYDFTFNLNGADMDLDSLHFDWAQPLDGLSTPVTFIAPYSYSSPLPDTSFNSGNKAATINNFNGDIKFKVVSPKGSFVLCNSVKSYRCGVLISEIFRDYQLLFKNCDPINAGPPATYNTLPDFILPFLIYDTALGFIDTLYVGDSVCFPITIIDFDTNAASQFQALHLEPTGQQLSKTFSDANDCLNPPCATISPRPDTTSGILNLTYNFCWKAACNHLRRDTSCQRTPAIHRFVFKAFDDNCPVPGLSIATISIVVIDTNTTVIPVPTLAFTSDTLFCVDTGLYSYQWYLDSVEISGDTLSYIIPVLTGNYSVKITLLNTCYSSQLSAPYFFLNTGVALTNSIDKISVIPNPFNDKVRIQFQNKLMSSYEINLLDVLGKQLVTFSSENMQSNVERDLDFSFVSPGIYFLQIKSGNAQKTIKLVKE